MIIISKLAPVINILPENVIRFIGNRISEHFLSKYANLEVNGNELLSKRIGKPTIFISNHLSNIDGIVLNKILKKNNVSFMAGIKLNANPLTSIFLKTVKHIPTSPNSSDKNAIQKALDVLNKGESILIFPEGTRSRSGSMIKGKKGVLLLARLSKADIVPIAIEGTELMLPINRHDMAKETLHKATVKVNIGKPFKPDKKNLSKDNKDEKCLYNTMRKIAQMLKTEYQGVYKVE